MCALTGFYPIRGGGVLSYWSCWAGGWAAARFRGRISLKPLDGLYPFEVVWNCLNLKLYNVMVVCPFAPYGLAHRPKICQIKYHWGSDFAGHISLKLLDGFTLFEDLWNYLNP